MASPTTTAGSIGLQRFGLGYRAGQPDDLRSAGARAHAGGDRGAATAAAGRAAVPGAAEIGAALYAFEDRERMAREARRVRRPGCACAEQQVADAPSERPEPDGPARPCASEPALPYRTYRDEVTARIALALEAETGFGERLVQFWSNHFCVAATKSNMTRIMAGAYEREAIRPHVFGRFDDMLVAVESHPAMLDFLDNRLSIGPGSPAGKRRGRGLNENLAREILELHTLGVSGGYAQADVTSLARIITGWTVVGREAVLGFPGSFAFNAGLHEPGAAARCSAAAMTSRARRRGWRRSTDLARHPATARFIALQAGPAFRRRRSRRPRWCDDLARPFQPQRRRPRRGDAGADRVPTRPGTRRRPRSARRRNS